jgi:hypothetical protein
VCVCVRCVTRMHSAAFQIKFEDLTLGRELGRGNFGRVCEAMLRG